MLIDPRRDEILEYFCQHLVGLCVAYRHKGSEDEGQPLRFSTCSGTILMVEGVVFFLTAGHVLKQLDDLRTCDRVEITGAALADTMGWKRISDVPIPFDLKVANLFYIDDDDEGLDFGVIMLDPHYVRLLAKNGVVAITEKNWIHQHTVEFDFYQMLGFPEEFTSGRVSYTGAGSASPTMFGVRRLESAPADRLPTRFPQFIGQLSSALPLTSVKGMSGGPIFGFRLKPELRYWIVALQSSWDPERRIVYGCDLPVLASLLTKWAKQASAA